MSGVTFFVAGTPIPQGSKSGFSPKGSTRVTLVDANKTVLKPWRAEVTRIARAAWLDRPQLEGVAVEVEAVFVFQRPATVRRSRPSVKPDLDKLVRAVFDGVTDARLWKDDGQATRLVTEKCYGSVPGVHVTVRQLSGDVPTRGERWLAEKES